MNSFHDAIAEALAPLLEMEPAAVREQLVRPPKPEMGDIGFPCFPLAKARRKAPPAIAQDLAEALAPPAGFAAVRAVGPYLNFKVDVAALAAATAGAALADPERWGTSTAGAGKTVVIDYSSPNIAKPLGVHHIRSTMIGHGLCRLYAAHGWTVVRVNHLGDWGTNFGQLMVSYKQAEAENPGMEIDVNALLELYKRYHAAAEAEEGLEEEARAWFKRLEDGDPEALRLWRIFVDVSLENLKRLYARLGVEFDHYTGESHFNDKMEATIARIEAANILSESQGAKVVDLEAEGMPPCLIRKGDGATTYATRDLAAAEYRQAEYGFAKCLYVVANQQELHFRQVFKVLEKMGHCWAGGCEHVKFGMLSFGDGVFDGGAVTASTRKGNIIYLEAVLDQAVEKARAIVAENARDKDVTERVDALAEQIGVGAIIFFEFSQRRMKDVVFTWEKALNLKGDSGPYLQYTHARLSSVRRKYEGELPASIDWGRLGSALEKDVLLKLGEFGPWLERALRENEPSIVAEYLLDLCAVFNRMFTDKGEHRIISEDEGLTQARVGLVEVVRLTLAKGLSILGLTAPERM